MARSYSTTATGPQESFASILGIALGVAALLFPLEGTAADPPPAAEKPIRELLVPFADLPVLLERSDQRVLLTRAEYEDLVRRAKVVSAAASAPREWLFLSADYDGLIQDGHLVLVAKWELEVLVPELLAIPLPVRGVTFRTAKLDGQAAPLARDANGLPMLFVQQPGRHQVVMEMEAPVVASAAQQAVSWQLPLPTATRWQLSVPGNVEVRSGADVLRREVDAAANRTRFELLPRREETTLVLSLNNRILLEEQVVLARSVLLDELTRAYDRLHATFSLAIPHGAVDRFRFALPEGFEVEEVTTPLLARWGVVPGANAAGPGFDRILEVQLREATRDTVVLNLVAVHHGRRLDSWTMPQVKPLQVANHVSVVGLLAEEHLVPQTISTEGLIPIDASVLQKALPARLAQAEPDAPTLQPVAAYFAPQDRYAWTASLQRTTTEFAVVNNLLLTISDGGWELLGGFAVQPRVESLFEIAVTIPAPWQVVEVTVGGETTEKLAWEAFAGENNGTRLAIRLPRGIPAGGSKQLLVRARATPTGWLGNWTRQSVTLPVFAVRGAVRQTGAVAVHWRDDLQARPDQITGLVPLDEREKAEFGWTSTPTSLAYRFAAIPYVGSLQVERTVPRVTARTFHFPRLATEGLFAHYEIIYQIEQARTRQLKLSLPASTPEAISIRGIDVPIKAYHAEIVEGQRQWTVELAEPRAGTVRLAIDFQQPLPAIPAGEAPGGSPASPTPAQATTVTLPLVRATDVEYQSGTAAVEGHAEFDALLTLEPASAFRKVDVGELVDAEYQAGKRLLGVWGFVGTPGTLTASLSRRPEFGLPAALVQRAELVSVLSNQGLSQSVIRYQLRTKAPFLEVVLPGQSTLWSAMVDGEPVAPQRDGEHLLISLGATGTDAARDLRVVYETPVPSWTRWGEVSLQAPQLWLRGDSPQARTEVPLADVAWHVILPQGQRVVRSSGTVFWHSRQPHFVPLWNVLGSAAGALHGVADVASLAVGGMARPEIRVMSSPDAYQLSDDVRFRNQPAPTAAMPGMIGGMGMGGMPGMDGMMPGMEGMMPGMEGMMPGTEGMAGMGGDPGGMGLLPGVREKNEKSGAEAPFFNPEVSVQARPAGQPARGARDETRNNLRGRGMVPAQGRTSPTDSVPETKKDAALEDKQVAQEQRAGGSAETAAAGRTAYWALQGVRSLRVELAESGDRLTFQSLGVNPRLQVTLAGSRYLDLLAAAAALVVLFFGLRRTGATWTQQFWYVCLVGAACLALPLIIGVAFDWDVTGVLSPSFYVVALLVPWYGLTRLAAILAGIARWCGRVLRRPARATAAMWLGMLLILPTAVEAQDDAPRDALQKLLTPAPARPIPADAIVVPYDPGDPRGVPNATKVFIPYAEYERLLRLTDPQRATDTKPPVSPYGVGGVTYSVTLSDGDSLTVQGRFELDIYTAEPQTIPLPLVDGVLTRVILDGQPARLQVIAMQPAPAAKPAAAQNKVMPAPPREVAAVLVVGRGKKVLEFDVRMAVTRTGGWRSVAGRLPTVAASAVEVRAPAAKTQVRLGLTNNQQWLERVSDRDQQQFVAAMEVGGPFRLQWRPQAAEVQVDPSLTAQSLAVLDVQEDAVRVAWQTRLAFRRGSRDLFSLRIPAEWLLERVVGDNVRGWRATRDGDIARVEVTLLQPATNAVQLTLLLSRRQAIGAGDMASFLAPAVLVDDAALHQGTLQIRRSPYLELQTPELTGLSRADVSAEELAPVLATSQEDSPLGIQPFQAFRFAAPSYTLRITATPYRARVAVETQAVLRLEEREQRLEARSQFKADDRAIYLVRGTLPVGFVLEEVVAPEGAVWSTQAAETGAVLAVFLPQGQRQFPLVIRGHLPVAGTAASPIPRWSLLDVARQSGQLVIQADPAVDVAVEQMSGCEPVLLDQVSGWLNEEQRRLARVALAFRSENYAATLRVSPREPRIRATTISNTRVTPYAIEDTVALFFTVANAGTRQVVFTLPAALRNAAVTVPLLRQRTVVDIPDQPGRVRVTVELQDEVMDQLMILVKHDRELTSSPFAVPLPVIETGITEHRFAVVESAGRDEVEVASSAEMSELNRQESQWSRLVAVLGDKILRAFAVREGAADPQLVLQTRQRATVEISGARIGLATTVLVVDGDGAYRGVQQYQVDNKTEQYLEIRLPDGAALWTASVADEPVRPAASAGPNRSHVLIPLVKTAAGDLDYTVQLTYGGRLLLGQSLSAVSFPLMRSVKIPVERSQVRLLLPEDRRWFDFGGTMTSVQNEAELLEGLLDYNRRQAQQLLGVIREGQAFSKYRAAHNLKQLSQALQSGYEPTYKRQSGGPLAVSGNAEFLKEAEAVLQQQGQVTGTSAATDNRASLELQNSGQALSRSRNVVSRLGNNFAADAPTVVTSPAKPAGGAEADFNLRWLQQNRLEAGEAKDQPERAAQQRARFANPPVEAEAKAQQQLEAAQTVNELGKLVEEAAGRQGRGATTPPTSGPAAPPERRKAVAELELQVERYQKRLADSTLPPVGQANQTAVPSPAADATTAAGALPEASAAAGAGGSGAGEGRQAAPAGLRSLEIDIPQRGVEYQFTTPRGEIEITARSLPERQWTRLQGLAAIAIGLVVLWLMILGCQRWCERLKRVGGALVPVVRRGT